MECPVPGGHDATAVRYGIAHHEPEAATTVHFEIAPDPDNELLSREWRRLPVSLKRKITKRVADEVVPEALALLGVEGDLIEEIGGYLGETNPSLAVRLTQPGCAMELAKLLGHVFSQQSVLIMSDIYHQGLERADAIVIHLPDEYSTSKVAALYERLWSLTWNGKKPITGHLTTENEMLIINYSEMNLRSLKTLVNRSLQAIYPIETKRVYAAIVAKSDYACEIDHRLAQFAARGSNLIERQDELRWTASSILRSRMEKLMIAGR